MIRKIGWILAIVCFFFGTALLAFELWLWTTAALLIGCGLIVVAFLLIDKFPNRKTAKTLRTILAILVAVGATAVGLTWALIAKTAWIPDTKECDYLIVLGAGVDGTVPSMSLQDRIDAAQAYLEDHPNTVCVVTGCQGSGENISEGECMFRELTAGGISADRIWVEDQAENTRQNLQYSVELIRQKTGKTPIEVGVVSGGYHLYRALYFADEQGISAFGVPAKSSMWSLEINYSLREVLAIWYYCFLGK